MVYSVGWLMNEIATKLEFDSTEPDQAFGGTAADPWIGIRGWLNETYTRIVNEARLECRKEDFEVIYAFTWSSGQRTYTLPREVAFSNSLFLMDVTAGYPGEEVNVYGSYRNSGLYWENQQTIVHPNSSGYSSDKNFELHYLAAAEELVDNAQVPVLIPARHRHLLVWATALLAREEVDEDSTPRSWYAKVDKLQENYMLDAAQGRLSLTIPSRIGGTLSEYTVG